ncbi:MAG: hypothetical protein ACI9KN_002649, partial [Gammaproteobacteria bacterium]
MPIEKTTIETALSEIIDPNMEADLITNGSV